MRLRASLVFVFGSIAAVAIAACSGGGGSSGSPPALHPSPMVASAAPLPSPVVNQSVAIAGGAAVMNAAIAPAPLPAPSGFTSSIGISLATVPAGTNLVVNSSMTIPATSSIPPLSSSRRGSASTRSAQDNGSFGTIFFDSIAPSQSITVAGTITVSQGFPAGALTAGTTYYLGFYDPTVASPAWQTISSATPTGGNTLTFSGTAGSTTLQASKTYGFAIFTVSGSTATPPPAPALDAYIPQGTSGITVVNAAGAVATALPIVSQSLGLDDSGNVYALQYPVNPTPAPSGAVAAPPVPAVLAKYAAGSSTASVTYTPSQPQNTYFNLTSGSGELAAFGNSTQNSASPTYQYQAIDVWNAGSTGGAPSATIIEPSGGVPFGILDHAGNLYVTHYTASGAFNYDVYSPPFSPTSVPSATIPEKIVPADQQYAFNPNYAAVGSDGTLYVTEYTFNQYGGQFDPLAGLYIYKPNASGGYTESFVATTADANGPGPEGVDVDANNNIYVANSNGANLFDANGEYLGSQNDSLHDITIYGPGGTAPRHVTGSFSALPVAVSADGTLFFSSFHDFNGDGGGVGASFSLLPSATTVTQVAPSGASLFALFDGSRETTGLHRKTTSVASGSSTHAGIGPQERARISAARSAFLKRLGKAH